MQTQNNALAERRMVPAAASKEAENSPKLIIESRYGTIELDPSTLIHFPNGLLGFPEWQDFALVDLGEPKFGQFGLLQSASDQEISFIVLPISPHNDLIAYDDIEKACAALAIDTRELVVLLLVSIRKSEDKLHRTVNLRAPLLIDASKFTGAQHVLPNDRYPIQLEI